MMEPHEQTSIMSNGVPPVSAGLIPDAHSMAGSQLAVSSGQALSAPVLAADKDLIEKEWVEAAKRIIEQNKQDPFTQSKALTILREDYMQKRYGKDIRAAK